MAVQEQRFTHKGEEIVARSDIIETDFGPEIRVDFFKLVEPLIPELAGTKFEVRLGRRQEPASMATIIDWWKDDN